MSLGRLTWLLLSIILACLALAAGVGLARELVTTRPLPRLREGAEPPPRSAPDPMAAVPRGAPPASYGAIAARSLFSVSRGETMAAATPVVAVGGPITLHGVMLDGEQSRAYLDDPAAGRVFGYGLGDKVAGGRLDRILEDRVVIRGTQGPVEILLHDPSKAPPENPTPAATAPQPGRRRGAGQPGAAPDAAPAPANQDGGAPPAADAGAPANPIAPNPGAGVNPINPIVPIPGLPVPPPAPGIAPGRVPQ
jgi:hypothetical protein